MADKANNQAGTAAKKGINKMEAVRHALAHFGSDAKPLEGRRGLKQQFGIDMSTDHISTYKGDIRRKQAGKAKAPTAKKPTASKPGPKKQPASMPQAQQAAARSNARPKKSNAGHRISLDDIQAVKGLVGRIGAEQLRSLIDLLAR